MSIVKSFSVGDGDMFYIKHNTDNFTIIDCYLCDDNKKEIVDEIIKESATKSISRFVSTHPDDDHIGGLEYLNERKEIVNFYCVKNEATKSDETKDFEKYCELRDSNKAFHLSKGCSRKWMNNSDEERGSSGLNCLWPVTSNEDYKTALEDAKDGESPNNISPIIKYTLNNGATILWMGDLENDFIEKVKNEISWSQVDILFAPHHGRDSGKLPSDVLEKLKPKIIVIGEAPSKNLNYYAGYDTIRQNSAGDITFECTDKQVHVYVSNDNYSEDFLDDEGMNDDYGTYIGTLNL
jgi:Predicted hydrolase (metallo-beta-lactamase superfamily)